MRSALEFDPSEGLVQFLREIFCHFSQDQNKISSAFILSKLKFSKIQSILDRRVTPDQYRENFIFAIKTYSQIKTILMKNNNISLSQDQFIDFHWILSFDYESQESFENNMRVIYG